MQPVTFSPSGDEAASDDRYVAACAQQIEGMMQHTLDHLTSE
jgi:hypothetical protein